MIESIPHLNKISPLQLDYLAEIYQIGRIESNGNGHLVSSANLAERLYTSQSTVNRVIERLRNMDLIQHERYVGVQLTASGEAEARKVLRRQGIIESFLVNVMSYDWYEVCLEARRMRHTISDRVLDRMWELAGNPTHSPFGEGIEQPSPTTDSDIVLAYADIKADYAVSRILTRQPDRLEYLAALGLKPGIRLHLSHKAPFEGPMQIQLGREYRIVGHELGRKIMVRPAE